MIYPNEGCPFAPPDPHGPGAAGFAGVSLEWIAPIDLPTYDLGRSSPCATNSAPPPVPVRRG